MKKIEFKELIALIGIVIASVLFGMLYFVDIPEGNVEIIHIGLGVVLGACINQVYNYFFGSSKGSSDKNEIIIGQSESKKT